MELHPAQSDIDIVRENDLLDFLLRQRNLTASIDKVSWENQNVLLTLPRGELDEEKSTGGDLRNPKQL